MVVAAGSRGRLGPEPGALVRRRRSHGGPVRLRPLLDPLGNSHPFFHAPHRRRPLRSLGLHARDGRNRGVSAVPRGGADSRLPSHFPERLRRSRRGGVPRRGPASVIPSPFPPVIPSPFPPVILSEAKDLPSSVRVIPSCSGQALSPSLRSGQAPRRICFSHRNKAESSGLPPSRL